VFLRGSGIGDILLDSIVMTGDNTSAEPLKPFEIDLRGDHIRAAFRKNEVLNLLSDPTNGSTHTVVISYSTDTSEAPNQLSATVTVTDEEDDGGSETTDFQLEIDPLEWSLNYTKSAGTVEAFIRGDDIDKLDLTAFKMKGDNPDVEAIDALTASINNNHIHVRFAKSLLMALLLDPAEGTTHSITVIFTNAETSEELQLTVDITIEEDDDEEEPEPTELTLDIEPDEWSLNFVKSSGLVKAFLYGEGLDTIDLESIKMMGDNPDVEPLLADSATLKGDHIQVRFPKSQVIGLLLDPEEGSTHTITILFTITESGEELFLTADIVIEDDEDDDDDDDDDGEEEENSDLELEIKPKQWNMNYSKGGGHVTAFITGDDIDKIDLDSFELEGDNGSAALPADSAKLSGNHVKADFPKNQVLDLLQDPTSGSTHTVTVRFTIDGTSYELTTVISITGKN
jgi:hypothetical protein